MKPQGRIPSLRIAACQFPVSCNIARNTKFIRRFMMKAAGAGSHVVHFPETALPGYARLDFRPSDSDNWQSLDEYTQEIANLAGELGLWVVLGSCRRITARKQPANCVHIISNAGKIVGTYDKQKLYEKETLWYTVGKSFLVITINGMKCGFLICYDSCFPALYEAYRQKGVQLLFHSCYSVSKTRNSNLDVLALAQFRTRAADNQMWLSVSNSCSNYSFVVAGIVRPDGSIRSLKRHVPGILIHDFPDKELGWTYDNRSKKV